MSALIIRHGNPASLPLDLLLSSIPSLSRAALDRIAQRAIDRMDELDGDIDLEADDESDPLDEHGEAQSDDGRGLHEAHPIYPEDQTADPLNYRDAERAHIRKEYGLDG